MKQPIEPGDEESTILGLIGYYLILRPLYNCYRLYLWLMTGNWEEP